MSRLGLIRLMSAVFGAAYLPTTGQLQPGRSMSVSEKKNIKADQEKRPFVRTHARQSDINMNQRQYRKKVRQNPHLIHSKKNRKFN